jgi:hypothetical protein
MICLLPISTADLPSQSHERSIYAENSREEWKNPRIFYVDGRSCAGIDLDQNPGLSGGMCHAHAVCLAFSTNTEIP